MADNPLLPQQRLRELHSLIQRVRKMERRPSKAGAPRSAREALVAAMLLHLGPGDLLSSPAADRTLRDLAPASHGNTPPHDLPANLRLPLCAGAARGMQATGTDRITVAFAEAGVAEAGWTDAITWAQRDELPLLLVCTDIQPRPAPRRVSRVHPPLTWDTIAPIARKLKLPVFPVDGHDAVAVYRVMQEATARARSHGGPSVLWGILSSATLTRRQQPLARLEDYMSRRNISLRA